MRGGSLTSTLVPPADGQPPSYPSVTQRREPKVGGRVTTLARRAFRCSHEMARRPEIYATFSRCFRRILQLRGRPGAAGCPGRRAVRTFAPYGTNFSVL